MDRTKEMKLRQFKVLIILSFECFSCYLGRFVKLYPIKCKGMCKQKSNAEEFPGIYLGKKHLEIIERDETDKVILCDIIPILFQKKDMYQNIVSSFTTDSKSNYYIDKGTCVNAASYFLSRDKGRYAFNQNSHKLYN